MTYMTRRGALAAWYRGLAATSLGALKSSLLPSGLSANTRADLKAAWRAWQDGEITRAQALAEQALAQSGADEARHLLFLTAFVNGQYTAALEHYRGIGASYRRRRELTEPVLDAHIHLNAVTDALAFARDNRGLVSTAVVQRLEAHSRRPLVVELGGVTTTPFADHPLTDLFPGFDVEINGQALTAHVDTGGSFLLMGPDRARILGLETVKTGAVRAHLNLMRVEMSYGIADRFVLGGAVLHHVPVDVLSTLTGENDLVIFGTNLMERFLSTLDYPGRRLILSRRGDQEAAAMHRAMLPGEQVSVPFYLWSDHFMFARGGLGAHHSLNFFVDSGLVAIVPDGAGGTRQASFTSSRRRLRQWGIPSNDIRRGHFISQDTLSLGPLLEERSAIVVGAAGEQDFGGVRIDGLISHAFLKRYVWTIDFDTREYRFATAAR
jgi:hypothetical protein